MVDAFIAVGSNIDPEKNIPRALRLVREKMRVKGVSTFYRTAPLGARSQREYLNGAFWVFTDENPVELHRVVLRQIEVELGRVRSEDKNAPRTIDLDLVVYDAIACEDGPLRLPDPELFEREFVAVPLAELAPRFPVPGDGRTFAEIAEGWPGSGLEREESLTRTLKEMLRDEHGTR